MARAEEALKLLVVVLVSLLARREFDDPMDGVVYGSMAGLGAALEESVFYRQSSPTPDVLVPAAELVRLWAHVVLSAREAPGMGPTLAGLALMLGSLALYGRLVLVASARSRTQFAPESARGLWGWPFRRTGSPR